MTTFCHDVMKQILPTNLPKPPCLCAVADLFYQKISKYHRAFTGNQKTSKNHRAFVRLPILSINKSGKTTVPLREIAFFEPKNLRKPPCLCAAADFFFPTISKNHHAFTGNCIFWTQKPHKTTVPLCGCRFFRSSNLEKPPCLYGELHFLNPKTSKNHRAFVRLPIFSFQKSRKTTVPLREIALFDPKNLTKPPCLCATADFFFQQISKKHRAFTGNCIFWTQKPQKNTVSLRETFFSF